MLNTWQKIVDFLLGVFLFILPWQTRYIYKLSFLHGVYNEYTTLSWYVVEILLWLVVIGFMGLYFFDKNFIASFKYGYLKKHPNRILATIVVIVLFIVYFFPYQAVTGQYISRLLAGICLGLLIIRSSLSFWRASLVLWLGSIPVALVGIWQFLSQSITANKWLGMATQDAYISGASVIQTSGERWLRAYGSFGSPNSFGIYLAVMFVLGLVLYFNFVKKSKRFYFLAGQVLILLGLLLSFSRGAWLSAVGGGLVFLFTTMPPGRVVNKYFLIKLVRSGLVYGLVVLVFAVSTHSLLSVRFKNEGVLENISISERQSQIIEARQLWSDYPIWGVGLGQYTSALSSYVSVPRFGFYQPIHNIYALVLVEFGLVGFIGVFYLVGLLAYRSIKENPIFLPVLSTLFLSGIFDHWLFSMFTGLIFWWVILGLGALGYLKKRED